MPVSTVGGRRRPLLEEGALASGAIVDLEILYSSRNLIDYEEIHEERRTDRLTSNIVHLHQ